MRDRLVRFAAPLSLFGFFGVMAACGNGASSTTSTGGAGTGGSGHAASSGPGGAGGSSSSTASNGTGASSSSATSSTGASTSSSSGGAGFTCSHGTLFAGVPLSTQDPGAEPVSGAGILSDPPVGWQTLVFSGTELYTRHEGEIWGVGLSAASPVETLITGKASPGSMYDYSGAAPCASASFTEIYGLAAMADGSLVISDLFASAVLRITNPTNPATCAVTVLAGNAGPVTGIDPSDASTYPPQGNADGVGTAASFSNLGALTVDSLGNVYVYDTSVADGSGLVRKIDTANGNKVTTLAKLGSDTGAPTTITNFTTIGTSLYAASRDSINDAYVIKIDTTTGAFTTIRGGNAGSWDPVPDTTDPAVTGITTDGTNLIVAGAGYVWYLTLSGNLTLLAGTGINPDYFPSGYDPTASQPALSLALPTSLGSADEYGKGSPNHIAYHQGAVYYRGVADGVSNFVEKISCP